MQHSIVGSMINWEHFKWVFKDVAYIVILIFEIVIWHTEHVSHKWMMIIFDLIISIKIIKKLENLGVWIK